MGDPQQQPVETWDVARVGQWLGELGLPQLQLAFGKNAVDGADLVALTDDDLTSQLGCTPLQARKIRTHLTKDLGVAPPPAAPSASTASASAASASAASLASRERGAEAAEPDPLSSFEAADLQRYQQLRAQLAALQGMQPAAKVSQAGAHLDSVRRALAAAQAAVPPVQQALAEEQAKVAKYSGEKFSMAKVFTTHHHMETKLEEHRAKADGLSKQLGERQVAVAAQQAELSEAQAQLAAWQGKASELAATGAQLQAHVERMFGTPAWRGSPRQAALADALRALEAQAGEAAQGASTYGRGSQLLQESTQLLQQALEGLQRTQMFTMLDMGMGGHNIFDDIIEMQIIRRSNDEIAAAAGKTQEARALLPGLPQVDERVLHSARMGIFQNILIGGLGSGMVEMAMIHRSKRDVETMQQQVAAASAWAQSNTAVYQHKQAEAQAQLTAKRGELEAFRSAALGRALAA